MSSRVIFGYTVFTMGEKVYGGWWVHEDRAKLGDVDRTEMKRRFGGMTHQLYKAFTFPSQSATSDVLESLGWRVWEDDTDIDEEIIDQSRSDVGHDPGGTILILITRDKGFVDLIDELKTQGVRLYFVASEFSNGELVEQVGRRRWIQWERNDFLLLPIRY